VLCCLRTIGRNVRLVLCVICCFTILTGAAHASRTKNKTPSLPSVQAELIGSLDFSRVKDGSPILARVIAEYTSQDCHLRTGAIVEGHITQVLSPSATQKSAEVQITFDKADCNDHPSSAYKFTLIALVGASDNPSSDTDTDGGQGPPLASAPTLTAMASTNTRSIFRSASVSSTNNPTSRPGPHLPPSIALGQVIDVSKTSLSVAAGIDGATIISTTARKPRLDAYSIFLLTPTYAMIIAQPTFATAGAASQPTASSFRMADPATLTAASATDLSAYKEFVPFASAIPTTAHTPSAPPADPVPVSVSPPDITEVCSSGCNIVGSMTSRVKNASTVSASIPITALGYSPRIKGFVTSFDDETTLTYLDQTHLLCTFDTHRLRVRDKDNTDSARPIRAVLIDANTHTIQKVMEWQVRGDHSYLWHLGRGEVLVHTGNQLRRFDANLNPLQSIPVDGPVAWVVSSPSSDHIAIAIRQLRYSETVYRELQKLGTNPNEDLKVTVYDQDFNLLSTSTRSAQTTPPVLSDQGELRFTRLSRDLWKLQEFGWNKSLKNIATIDSVCTPQVSVPEPALIFITGCKSNPTGKTIWYRVLHSNGHPLLNGDSPDDEMVQSVHGSVANSFAVRVFKSTRPIDPNQPLNLSDYTREEIGIYRSSNGSRLSSITTDDFILAQNSSALSPRGDQLALAGKNAVLFYDVKLP